MLEPERPDLSVVIVNLNTRQLLQDCLESIAKLPDALALEVIVIDNGSTDGSAEMVRDSFPETRLIRNETNTGFAFPNNQGLAISRGRHVILLNSDTVVLPYAFERLVGFMDEHPDVGACGPTLRYPDGRLQPSCQTFPSLWLHICQMLLLDNLFPRSRWLSNQDRWFDYSQTGPVDQPMGAALLVRREVIDSVGMLDERFRIHYNDVDWCYRIHKAGWQIFFVHSAEIIHHLGVTTRNENRGMRLQPELLRNAFDYHEKHFGKRGLFWYRFWLVIGFSFRRAACFVLDAATPSPARTDRSTFVKTVLRAAWTGKPGHFAGHAS